MADTYQVGNKIIDIDSPEQVRSLTSDELSDLLRQAGQTPDDPEKTESIFPTAQRPKGTFFAWFSTPSTNETE